MMALRASLVVVILAVTGIRTFGQPAPIVTHDFEGTDHGWQSMGASGRVTLTTAEGTFKSGKSALKFEYLIEPGEMSALMLPMGESAPAGMKSIAFWAKSPAAMPLLVVLQERGGGRYQALAFIPANRWQRVELALSDFTLGRDKDDPKDPNNKLDIEQLEAVAVADLAQMLAGVLDSNLIEMLGIRTGARMFFLDDITASTAALPVPTPHPGELIIDAFMRPQIGWFVTGHVRAEATADKPLEGKGMRLDYALTEGQIAAAMRGVPEGFLAKSDKLLMSMASAKATSVMVQLEESSGGKYNATVALEGDQKLRKVSLPFADFTVAEDSRDDNGKLDRAQIKQIIIADLSFSGAGAPSNTLWIGPVRASKVE